MSAPQVIDNPEARAWVQSEQLAVDVDAQRTGSVVMFIARVRNTSRNALDWVYLTTGERGETSPVWVMPTQLTPRPEPARAPTGIPFPTRVRMQPGAELRYEVRLCLEDYERPWPASLALRWSVQAWGKSRREGELVVAPK